MAATARQQKKNNQSTTTTRTQFDKRIPGREAKQNIMDSHQQNQQDRWQRDETMVVLKNRKHHNRNKHIDYGQPTHNKMHVIAAECLLLEVLSHVDGFD